MRAIATIAIGLLCVAFAYKPACSQIDNGDWVGSSLGCTVFIDNQCLRAVHRHHDYSAIERQRRQYRAYVQREAAWRAEHREEIRREERREERRDERETARYFETRDGRRVEVFPERRGQCLEHRIKRVGTEHIIENNAKLAAEYAWAEEVRYRYGERYLDLRYARGITYTCSKSSIPEGIVNKIENAVGAYKTRCEIEARPCLPAPVSAEK